MLLILEIHPRSESLILLGAVRIYYAETETIITFMQIKWLRAQN